MRSKPKKNGADRFAQTAVLWIFALWIFTFGIPCFALAQGARVTQGEPAPNQPQSIWGVNCAGVPGGLDCRAVQNVRMTNTGQLSVAVRLVPETKKPMLLLVVPLGIQLPAGVTLQFGQEEARVVPLQNCDASGCLAQYALTDADIAAMVRGQTVTVKVQDPNKQTISVQVPSTGFAAAYAKIK